MRRCLTAILVVGLISTLTPRDAAAQPSDKDLVAYAALIGTPVGALSPIMIAPGTKGDKSFNSFAGRYAHYSPQGGGDGNNTFGASFYHKAGMNAAVSGTAAYLTCSGCDGMFMVGADVHSTLWNSTQAKGSTTATSVNLQGSLGYGSQSGTSALSFVVGVPLAITMDQSNKSRISAFVTPGFGWGRLSDSGASESGTLPLVGAGGSWASAAGWGIHASYQRVIISDVAGNTFGLGFSWQMGK
jgi:hypothetical protein